MAPRSIASGTISFGLVSIPVKLYAATEASAGISFNLLHAKCGSRLKQQYVCPQDGEVVPRDAMVKGYEFQEGKYVTFSAEELKALEREYRQELPKEIQRALQMGDLRENAEYQSALERQHYVKARIGQIQEQLRNLSMIDLNALPKDRVALGSSVTVYDAEADRTLTYELVLPEEADFPKGFVSVTSPIGRALMGRREGEEVTVKVPSGTRVFEITRLVTIHQKEDA